MQLFILDSDFQTIKHCVLKWFKILVRNLNPEQTLKDPKTRLQEFLQRKKLPLPKYDIIDVAGKSHAQTLPFAAPLMGVTHMELALAEQ